MAFSAPISANPTDSTESTLFLSATKATAPASSCLSTKGFKIAVNDCGASAKSNLEKMSTEINTIVNNFDFIKTSP